MLSTLMVAQVLMLLPLLIVLPGRDSQRFIIDLLILIAMMVAIVARDARVRRRREILEDELLSIHSCAIVWQAVVICHYFAIHDGIGLQHYTERLARQAEEVATNAFSIHSWLESSGSLTAVAPVGGSPAIG